MNHDESEALEQQKEFDIPSIGVPEISVNPMTTTTVRSPSILKRFMAGKSSREKMTATPKQYLHLADIFSTFNSKFPQLKRVDASKDNLISDTSAEMIEIEVPLVGSEFTRNFNVDVERIKSGINFNKESEEDINEIEVPEGYVEISVMPATTTETLSKETTNFQSLDGDSTTFESFHETFPSVVYTTENPSHKSLTEDMEGVENKVMNQWNHLDDVGDDHSTTQKTEFHTRKHSPMIVTIVVNGQKSRCRDNSQCRQVNFAKHYYDIDRQYPVDSDEDLFFNSEPYVYSEKRNQLKSRRAADDGYFGFPRSDNNYFNFPQPVPRANMPPMSYKKPKWIEKLENESSIERSERVNKNLGDMMKMVAIWAHLDKFATNRARSIVGKILNLGFDEPSYDNNVLKSSSSRDRECDDLKEEIEKLKELMPKNSEPFT